MLSLVDYADSDEENEQEEEQTGKDKLIAESGETEHKDEKKTSTTLLSTLSAPKTNVFPSKSEKVGKKMKKKRKRKETITFQVPIDVQELKRTEKEDLDDTKPSLPLSSENNSGKKSINDFLPPPTKTVANITLAKRRKPNTANSSQFSNPTFSLVCNVHPFLIFFYYTFSPFTFPFQFKAMEESSIAPNVIEMYVITFNSFSWCFVSIQCAATTTAAQHLFTCGLQ
jgi:hypothetical protein